MLHCVFIVKCCNFTTGFAGWVHDAVCELNDPRMVPHTLVVPLRGGDRMWMDCHDKSACALETAIAKVNTESLTN